MSEEISKTTKKMNKNPCTLKKHPKMDLNKADMLQLLSYLEGELQARDIAVAVLYSEKVRDILKDRLDNPNPSAGDHDPLAALQRDSEFVGDDRFGEEGVRSMYDDQLGCLDELILAQKSSQKRMKELLVSIEKRYSKTNSELEAVKAKHSVEVELDDNITYLLERERERLNQELELEKSQLKKLEKEMKRLASDSVEDDSKVDEYKQIAVQLIKEQTHMMRKLSQVNNFTSSMQKKLEEERVKAAEITKAIEDETLRHMHAEAMFEKQFSEFDFEREQLKLRLAKAEARHKELIASRGSYSGQTDAPLLPDHDSKKPEITKISLQTLSPNSSSPTPRFLPPELKKLSPSGGRGMAPPVPPNKPNIMISNQPSRLPNT